MLATITLATDNDWIGVWIGSTVGMVAADALAIIVGSVLGKHLPDGFIKIGAAVLFFVFGVWLLLEGHLPRLVGRHHRRWRCPGSVRTGCAGTDDLEALPCDRLRYTPRRRQSDADRLTLNE